MNNLEKEVQEIVSHINSEIADKLGDKCELYLVFGSSGFALDICIDAWQAFCSEIDDRRYDDERDEYEPLEDCVRRKLRGRAIEFAKAFGITAEDFKG